MIILETLSGKVNTKTYSNLLDSIKRSGLKYKKNTEPPKEYKSSPYKVWVNIRFDYNGFNSVQIVCADEETAIQVSLLI